MYISINIIKIGELINGSCKVKMKQEGANYFSLISRNELSILSLTIIFLTVWISCFQDHYGMNNFCYSKNWEKQEKKRKKKKEAKLEKKIVVTKLKSIVK